MAEPNFANRTLFHGDNLGFLQGLNSGSVHLIATDPPFNKGRDFHATPDSLAAGGRFEDRWAYDKDVHPEWIDALKDFDAQRKRTKRKGEYQQGLGGVWTAIEAADTTWGKDMGAFLCYMGVRLLEMRRVLHEDGSLYLHCDPTASHYLKIMLDAIFGKKNFRNEIIWQRNDGRGKGSQHDPKAWGKNTDSILYYAKSGKSELRPYRNLTDEEIDEKFPLTDERTGRRYYTGIPIFCSRSMGARPNLCYEWRGFRNPHPSGWRLSRARLEEEYKKGNVVIREDGKLERRKYIDDYEGMPVDNCWVDIPRLTGNSPEDYGYATQKPLDLYDRIIRASSNPGDIVLDPFAGCATTVVAAELANRQWIGMDIWDGARNAVVQRLLTEGMLRPSGVPDSMLADLTLPDSPQAPLGFRELNYVRTPPTRTDEGDIAAPAFTLPAQRAIPRWQRLSRAEIVERLEKAQAGSGGVICGGCGIVLAAYYMELDHVLPRADGGANDITNRLLICGPCNGTKGAVLTLSGLRRELKKKGRLVSPDRAELAHAAAKECAERTKVELSG